MCFATRCRFGRDELAISMRPAAKAGLVAIGYIAALAIAFLVTRIYIAATNGPDRQTYGAMFDFGDSLLFLGVFGLASRRRRSVPARLCASGRRWRLSES